MTEDTVRIFASVSQTAGGFADPGRGGRTIVDRVSVGRETGGGRGGNLRESHGDRRLLGRRYATTEPARAPR